MFSVAEYPAIVRVIIPDRLEGKIERDYMHGGRHGLPPGMQSASVGCDALASGRHDRRRYADSSRDSGGYWRGHIGETLSDDGSRVRRLHAEGVLLRRWRCESIASRDTARRSQLIGRWRASRCTNTYRPDAASHGGRSHSCCVARSAAWLSHNRSLHPPLRLPDLTS